MWNVIPLTNALDDCYETSTFGQFQERDYERITAARLNIFYCLILFANLVGQAKVQPLVILNFLYSALLLLITFSCIARL